MKEFFITGILIAFMNIFPSYPQFQGGKDDGMGNGIAYGLLVEGNKTLSSVFYGGQQDGFSSSSKRLHLSGASPAGLFFGGLGEGSEQEQSMVSISGTSMKALFSGGKAEGHDVNQFSFFPSGIAADDLYSGGMGEGFSISSHTNTLQNGIPIAMYAGGDDEGTSVQTGYDGIAVPNIDMFNGSFNDGHIFRYYKGLLDQDAYSTIFQGGADDGFYIEIQSVTLTSGSVGISRNISTEKITIYPNPVTERFFYVKLWETYTIDENLQMNLTTIDGKEIPIEVDVTDNEIKVKYLVPVSKGVYILTLHFADNTRLLATIVIN